MSRKTEFRDLPYSTIKIFLEAERCGIIEEVPDGNGWLLHECIVYKEFLKKLPKDPMFLAMLEYRTALKNETIC